MTGCLWLKEKEKIVIIYACITNWLIKTILILKFFISLFILQYNIPTYIFTK